MRDKTTLFLGYNELVKENKKLTQQNWELAQQNWELEEELHKRHKKNFMPIIEQAATLSKINVYLENLHEIGGECLSASVNIPSFKFQTATAMNFRERAIRECAMTLSYEFSKRIALKFQEVYQEEQRGE